MHWEVTVILRSRTLGIGIGIALVSALALALPAWAGPGGRRGAGPAQFERMIERLDLDEATLERVDAVLDASRGEGRKLRRQMRAASKEMRKLLKQDSPSEEAVLSQAEKLGELRTQAQKHRLSTMLKVRAVLSPEQREKLRKHMRSMRPGHGKGSRWHGGPGHHGQRHGKPEKQGREE